MASIPTITPPPPRGAPNPTPRAPLKIAIVGGGIGGMSAAVGLRGAGHDVTVYEQSTNFTEQGAAIHLAPNANGILRRWGITAESFGGNAMSRLVEHAADGRVRRDVDLSRANERWQHPWHLVHRGTLHVVLQAQFKQSGGVAKTKARVEGVESEAGRVLLERGEGIGDVVVGADGIYSTTRSFVKDAKLFSSGKAAFRFLIPRRLAEEDPVTAPLVEKRDALHMWYGEDRRIVMYPCNNNDVLNFVCIHPDTESFATERDEWGKQATLYQLLEVYKDFDPVVKALMTKVAHQLHRLQVWQLLDMKTLPTWTTGRLVLLGDAAHPFTPHQGQGAGQAIEDAAALTVVLPLGTTPDEVPERLALYQHIRYERAHVIQEYSRLAGRDWVNGEPTVDMMAYTNYNFGHDELDHATNIFKRWQWAKNPDAYRFSPQTPTPFGPFSLPEACSSIEKSNSTLSHARLEHPRTKTIATLKFKTSRTFLETLLPTSQFRFTAPDTVATASYVTTMTHHPNGAETNLRLYFHGVQYTKADGSVVAGSYLPAIFGPSTEGEVGVPSVPCEVAMECVKGGTCRVVVSWEGVKFGELGWEGVKFGELGWEGLEEGKLTGEEGDGVLMYQRGGDGEKCVVLPHAGQTGTFVSVFGGKKAAEVKFEARDWEQLPTLHHVVAVLADIPVLEALGVEVAVVGV
ncbi:hypothetical protein B0H67DRAFT_640038 [Lasiosphaeris hirsuta]|uniref:FAD-binding domain-containing protein n=1 Tax=Lasiosphaeris hirsuta TaxID=260670 RepID=A0AA40EB24_9PEZI|nr:hypothetical protein B0H67DRAFT_640038 [Lasiosphaeris hirsuta]